MTSKKKILTTLSVVLILGLAVLGILAYFTDQEHTANVMTVGNVNVDLEEKQRNEEGTALEPFVQGKELTPLVGSAQAEKDQWGQPVLKNYVDKIVYATNNGANDAYIRFLVAVPVELIPDTVNSSNNPLHWNYGNRVDITGTGKYNEVEYADSDWAKLFTYADIETDDEIASVTIDGEEYWVTYFTMQQALEPGESSLAVMSGLYLDNRVDYDADLGKYTFDGEVMDYDLSNGVKIPVMVQAVQTDGWDSVDQAFEESFGALTVANAEAWFEGTKIPTVVNTADDLQKALNNGGSAVLTEDAVTTAPIKVDGGTLYGGGNTLDASNANTNDWGNYAVTLENGGSVEDVKVENAFYGVGSTNTTEDIYINDVVIDKVTYAINGNGNGEASVYVTNSTIYGWCSYADVDLFSFTNCTLGMGNSADGYLVVYGDTSFENCKFEGVFDMGARAENGVVCAAGKTVELTNCTYDGVKVTADNFVEYFYYGAGDEEDFGNLMRECTIIVDGVKVDNSAYVN